MTKIYTERQLQFPSKLDILKGLDKRKVLSDYQVSELNVLTYKQSKVNDLFVAMKQYGKNDWQAYHNISLSFLTDAECDLILLTQTGSYFFQIFDPRVKNIHTFLKDIENIYNSYTDFFKSLSVPFHLTGAIVVPDGMVHSDTLMKAGCIHMISESKIETYFNDLASKETQLQNAAIDIEEIKHWLNEIDTKCGNISLYVPGE